MSNGFYAADATLVLLSGSGAATARSLAPDTRAWLADSGHGRRAELCVLSGADVVGSALERLDPASPVLEACFSTPEYCWAEVTRQNETCLVRCALHPGGLVRHLVLLRAPLVPSRRTGESTAAPPGRPTLERYFDDLMNARFEDAAAHFTSDTIYFHPPYSTNGEWALFRGRDALLQGWLTLRGPSPARQIITGYWQIRDRFFVQGVVDGIPHGGSFFSMGQLTNYGEISRYIAFYTARRIPSLDGLDQFSEVR
jgi:hypothetical protein